MGKFSKVAFERAREEFHGMIQELQSSKSLLSKLEKRLKELANNEYEIINPVVYNKELDGINPADIKLIIVADNPGKEEQAEQRYLVDKPRTAGHLAQNFFSAHPELGIEFRRNVGIDIKDVLVLNKTPIHSPKTDDLKKLATDDDIKAALKESQKKMAILLVKFQEALNVPVWIVGSSEMEGAFKTFTETLKELYTKKPERLEGVSIFNHFSRNCFTTDLKTLSDKPLEQALLEIGRAKREKYLR